MGRYLIYGAGAIGSVFGGMLARAGHNVCLVGRRPHMEAVRKKGLIISGLLGQYHVENLEPCIDLNEVENDPPVAAVFISVKSNGTADAVADLVEKGLVSDRTSVVSLQNGLGNLEQLREAFGAGQSFGGRVIFGASVPEPGSVHVSVWADRVLIGGPDTMGGKASGRDLARLITDCGIETEAVDNIQAALWGKVLYNTGLNPLSALLNVPYGELGNQENARGLLETMIREAYAVASREVELPWVAADQYLEYFFQELLPPTKAHRSSMLQDISRGRETEIDAITGQIISRARQLDIPVAASTVVYKLVKAMEAVNRS